MEQIDSRPLTVEELKALRKHAPSPLLSLWPPIAAGGFFLLLFTAAVLLLAKYVALVRAIQPFLFAAFAIWLAPQMLSMYRSERRRSETIRKDLEGGKAEVRRYEVTDAIRVEEFEDEGTGFYLRLKDGRTLFLVGQHFYELEDEKKFPCTTFEIAETPNAKWPLGFTCTGAYFPPSLRRGPFPESEVKSGRTPCDGDLLEVDFESLKKEP